MADRTIVLGTAQVLQRLAALGPRAKGAAAESLNKVAFDVLDAEEQHLRGAFKLQSGTERFLGRSFQFDKATAANLVATVKQRGGAGKERRARILGQQQEGGIFGPPDPGRFPFGDQLVVPTTNVRRTTRGLIPRNLLPAQLIARGRAFVRGNVVLESRTGRVLYALVQRVRIPKRIDVYRVARETAERVFESKVARAVEKAARTR